MYTQAVSHLTGVPSMIWSNLSANMVHLRMCSCLARSRILQVTHNQHTLLMYKAQIMVHVHA